MLTYEMLQIIIDNTQKSYDNELMLYLAQSWIDVSSGKLSLDALDLVYDSNREWFESVVSDKDNLGSIIKDIYGYNLGIHDKINLIPRLENLYQSSVVK